MLSEIPSVDITRSLNPFLFTALANCFSFLAFFAAALSLSRISRSSFSSGGYYTFYDIIISSNISNHPEFQSKLMATFLCVVDLYTLILFRPSFSSLIFQYFTLTFSIDVYLCFDKLLDSLIGSPDQYLQYFIDLTLSLVGCTSRAMSLFNWMFINVLKNLCS